MMRTTRSRGARNEIAIDMRMWNSASLSRRSTRASVKSGMMRRGVNVIVAASFGVPSKKNTGGKVLSVG